jgi:uncharacterized membrane protein HdeD (DUF308 family)
MSRLDDFLGPLHHGVWEVEIPKESVTEPLDTGWERSALNVPSPGTIASYRKGQYHVHETETEWHVHIDRYDPKIHPFMHLVDDAPLLLMIGGTVVALARGRRGMNARDTNAVLEEQMTAWQIIVLIGISMVLVGILIVLNPHTTFGTIANLLIPALLIILGAFIISKGMKFRPFSLISGRHIFMGAGVIVIGAVSLVSDLELWGAVILAILSLWGFGSAIMALRRISHGKKAVPDGFFKWLAIGVLSFLLTGLIVFLPYQSVALLMILLGIIAVLLGITLVVNGFRLRQLMKEI